MLDVLIIRYYLDQGYANDGKLQVDIYSVDAVNNSERLLRNIENQRRGVSKPYCSSLCISSARKTSE